MQKEFGVAYVRISVVQDGQSKISDEVQAAECNKFLKENGIEIFNEYGYRDINVSGGDLDRPMFQKLLIDIEKYNIRHICIYDVTRLSRSIFDITTLFKQFEKLNVKIYSAMDRKVLDLNNWNNDTFMTLIQSVFGNHEREIVRKKVLKSMATLCKNGFSVGGPVPFSMKKITVKDQYGKDRTSFAIESDEKANLIREVFDLFLSGKSYREITEYLNSREDYLNLLDKEKIDKIRGRKNSKNTHMVGQKYLFNLGFVARTLDQFLYTGYMCSRKVDRTNKSSHTKNDKSLWLFSDNYVNGGPCDFEPIISLDTWHKAQELKAQRNPNINKNFTTRGDKSRFLLSGLLVCGGENGCMRRMVGKTRTNRNGKSYNYYYCKTAKKNGEHICGNRKDVRCEKIDLEIINLFKNHVIVYQLIEAIHDYCTQSNDSSDKIQEYNTLTFRIKELEEEIRNTIGTLKKTKNAALIDRIYSEMEEQQQEIDKLKQQANALNSVITNVENEQVTLLNLVSNILNPNFKYNDSLENTIKMRNLLKKFIKMIIYSPNEIEVRVYAPKNITAINPNASIDFRIVSPEKMKEMKEKDGAMTFTAEDINKKTDPNNLLYLLAETWDKECKEGLTKENLKLLNKCLKILEEHKEVQQEQLEEFKKKFAPKTEEDALKEFKHKFGIRNEEEALKEFTEKFGPVKKHKTTRALIGDLLSLWSLIPALVVIILIHVNVTVTCPVLDAI